MKKILSFIFMVIVLISLTACLNNGDDDMSESDGEITVLLDNKDRGFLETIITNFEAAYVEEGYTVNPIWTSGGDLHSSQATKIGAGNPPDLIIGGDMYTEVYRRALLDLTPLIERDSEELALNDIVDGVMERLDDSEGRTVFLPRYFNVSLLYYNKGLFDTSKDDLLNAGITAAPEGTPATDTHYPHLNWTIDDYFKAGGVLTQINNDGAYVQLGSTTVGSWWGEWLIHLRQSGGDLFDENGFVTFNNDHAKAAMQIWRDKAYGNETLSRPKIGVAPGETDFGGFQGGRVAMEYGGHTANWSRYDAIEGLDWGVTLLPTGLETRNGAEFAIEGIGIHKDSGDVEAAWAFIKYLTNEDGIQASVDEGYLAIRKSVFEAMPEGAKKDRTELALTAIDPNGPYAGYAMTLPKLEYFTDVAISLVNPVLQLMLANDASRISIDEAVSRIERQSNDYIMLNYK